jgi:lsr operon transcriptional repressor
MSTTVYMDEIALVSVGTVDLDSFLFHAGYSDELGIEGLQRLGAVGDILGHFFDSNGLPVPNPIEDRLMALSLDELSNIPVVICAAGGLPKVQSILGALCGGYVNVLITDEDAARAILGEAVGEAHRWEVDG